MATSKHSREIKIEPVETGILKDDVISIDEASITYLQGPDNNSASDEEQAITISADNNGVARYISIKTDRWSINDVDDLVAIINDFKKRVMLCPETQEQ